MAGRMYPPADDPLADGGSNRREACSTAEREAVANGAPGSPDVAAQPVPAVRETASPDVPDGERDVWILAQARVLPEVFTRVLRAKYLLASGQAETSSEAARLAGLSRSAFYRYKDAVFPYDEDKQGRILTVHFLLHDRPGVLSAVLTAFADAGANILTVNQNIPAAGRAAVSVSARTDRLRMTVEAFVDHLRGLQGVEKITRVTV